MPETLIEWLFYIGVMLLVFYLGDLLMCRINRVKLTITNNISDIDYEYISETGQAIITYDDVNGNTEIIKIDNCLLDYFGINKSKIPNVSNSLDLEKELTRMYGEFNVGNLLLTFIELTELRKSTGRRTSSFKVIGDDKFIITSSFLAIIESGFIKKRTVVILQEIN